MLLSIGYLARLLCPLAFLLDLLMFVFHGIAYAAYLLGWLLEHVGAPLFFASALACVVLGALALRTALREAKQEQNGPSA